MHARETGVKKPAAAAVGGACGHVSGILSVLLSLLLWTYRAALSPFLGPCCRFVPSCSLYAGQAIRRHGVTRGSWLAVTRVLRCHPLHPGGWDPVP